MAARAGAGESPDPVAVAPPPTTMRQLPYASVSLPERQRAEAATGTESPEREREWWGGNILMELRWLAFSIGNYVGGWFENVSNRNCVAGWVVMGKVLNPPHGRRTQLFGRFSQIQKKRVWLRRGLQRVARSGG
jgi:hypothetical protein